MRRAALLRIQPPVQRVKLCQLRLAAREHGVERHVALHAGTGAGTHTTASVILRTLAAHKRVLDQRSSHTASKRSGSASFVFAMAFRQPEHHYLAGSSLRRRLSRKERRSSALVLPSKKPPVIERSAKLAVQWHIIVSNSITYVHA